MKTHDEVLEKIASLKAIGSHVSLAKARELEWVAGLNPEEDPETDMVANMLLGSLEEAPPSLWDRLPKFAHTHNLYTFSRQKEEVKKIEENIPYPPAGSPQEAWDKWGKEQGKLDAKRRELELGKVFSWKKLLGPEGFKEAKGVFKKLKHGKYEEGFYTKIPDVEANIDKAELIASINKDGTHRPMLDIDFPAVVIPSTTEGHCHLYIDKEMPWKDYKKLLNCLADLGIIEHGYRGASLARGYSALRLPWIKKPKNESDFEKITLDF